MTFTPLLRRILSITTLTGVALLLPATALVWIPLSLVLGLFRRANFIIFRLFVFLTLYAWGEVLGIVVYIALRLRYRTDKNKTSAVIYSLQTVWARGLFWGAKALLQMRLTVSGAECLHPGPILLFMRHSSLIDTLLPTVVVSGQHGYRLRFILKKVLLWDPCLDLVGNYLPNYFVDRNGNTAAETTGVGALAVNLGTFDGVIIYPEGTRFSATKRTKILKRMKQEGHKRLDQAEAMDRVLPPRTGGPLALIRASEQSSVVFCAHQGLEPFANIKTLLTKATTNITVCIHFWRIERAAIPTCPKEQRDWIFDQWAIMNATVQQLENA